MLLFKNKYYSSDCFMSFSIIPLLYEQSQTSAQRHESSFNLSLRSAMFFSIQSTPLYRVYTFPLFFWLEKRKFSQ